MEDTLERTSQEFPGVEPPHLNSTPFFLAMMGRWMERGRAGTDHSGMMDLSPDQKPSGSSGAVSRGERSPS